MVTTVPFVVDGAIAEGAIGAVRVPGLFMLGVMIGA